MLQKAFVHHVDTSSANFIISDSTFSPLRWSRENRL